MLLCLWFAWGCGWKTLAAALAAAASHEAGHAVVLWMFGGKIRRLRVSVLGAVIETDAAALSYGQELLAILAGPGTNLVLGAILAGRGSYLFAGAHMALCLFNLLPLRPLDGGRALETALLWCLGPARAEGIARAADRLMALGLGGGLLFLMGSTGGSLWLMPSCGAALRKAVQRNRNSSKFL